MPDSNSHNQTENLVVASDFFQTPLGLGYIQEELKRASQLGSVFTDLVKQIEDTMMPHRELFKRLAEEAEYAHRIQKDLFPNLTELMKPLTDTTNLFQDVLRSMDLKQSVFDQYKGLLVDVPFTNYFKQLDVSTKFELSVSAFQLIDRDSCTLQADVAESKTYSTTEYRVSASFDVRLSTIETMVQRTDRKLDFLLDDAKAKDGMILDLLTFAKSNSSGLAKIEQIDYVDQHAALTIDGKVIQLRPNTNQSELCRVIFADQASIDKTWHFDEVLQQIDSDEDYSKEWATALYGAAYQLNSKIYGATGKEHFLILTKQTATINPKHLLR